MGAAMTTSLACPARGDLERLAEGQLPEPEAEQIGRHILACSACANLLNSFQASDPLVPDLQTAPRLLLPDNPFVDALVERLVGTPPQSAGAAAPSASATETPGASGDSEPLPDRLGRYQVIGRLGAGGMGVVGRANDPHLRRDVAIKVPNFRGSDDAQAAARQRFSYW
jgi:hypothetical protein